MKHPIGLDEEAWSSRREPALVIWDSEALINPHTVIMGMTGTGKSESIRKYLATAARAGVEVDVFDSHEELNEAPGSVAAKFSQRTQLGFNPLVPHLDQDSGGLRVQADFVVDIINRTGRVLGNRQASALKNLIRDAYFLRGMYPDDPRTWVKQEITESQRERLIADRRWSDLRDYYPTLRDLISLAERKLKAMSTGGDSHAVTALERVERTAARLHSTLTKSARPGMTDEEIQKLKDQLDRDKEEAIERYANFINSLTTGREFQDLVNYTNAETLLSLRERLYELVDCGIFLSNPPPWEGANIRVHQIGSLPNDKRRLLFELRAEAIFRKCQDQGKTNDVRHIICVDEAAQFCDEDKTSPINRIANEGRKFGLMLLLGSQNPEHFSKEFLTACGTIILLGIQKTFWPIATSRMDCEKRILESVRMHETLAIQMQRKGEASAKFKLVNINRQNIQESMAILRSKR